MLSTLLVAYVTLFTAPQGEPTTRSWTHSNGTRVTLHEERDASGAAGASWFSVRTVDGRRVDERATDFQLYLQSAAFDPLNGRPAPLLVGAPGALRIVQFATQVLPEYTAALAELGVEVHRFLPAQGLIVTASQAQLAALAELPYVRWTGPYASADRIEPTLAHELAFSEGPLDVADYQIQVLRRGLADKQIVRAAIEARGGEVQPLSAKGYLLRARLDDAALRGTAELDAVLWIERARSARTYVDKIRSDGGADSIEASVGLSGQGVRGEVVDLGIYPHIDFATPVVHNGLGPIGYHGTPVSGIVFGRGIGNAAARGLLPQGQMIFSTFTKLVDRYTHTEELLLPPFEAVFQTNSWGYGVVPPSYPSDSFELDDVVHRYDLLTCQAMGNSGGQGADGFAWAKNVVSVGGVRHQDTETLIDDAWDESASVGPAQDGRLKPDLCYWYDHILSTSLIEGYETFGGTSATTPAVAGHFGLAAQIWFEELLGNVADGSTVFESRPKSATLRALVFNSARSYDFDGSEHDLGRFHQGWGRPNVEDLLAIGDGNLVVNGSRPLRNLETHDYQVEVLEGQETLRATLVYTDLPGTSSATQHRVNDLTLRLVSPSGVTYWGNHGLDTGNVTPSGGTRDRVNTCEQVWLVNPEPGTWVARVSADEIVSDAYPKTAAVDAAFALVVAPIRGLSTDLGDGLAGTAGVPSLTAHGYFLANEPMRLDLVGAAPGSMVVFEVSASPGSLSLAGGPQTAPGDTLFMATADAQGAAQVQATLSSNFSAPTVFARAWVVEPVGNGELAASNLLELQTP